MRGMMQLEYADFTIFERRIAGSRHHEARCRWCVWTSGWLVQTFESSEAATDHLVAKH